jgi:membrane protein DedA with SNARE-associated domain
MFESLTEAISGSSWSYAIIFGIAFLDSFFPVVPSETAVIIGGVYSAAGNLSIALVILCAATGAFLGDNFTYGIGHTFGERVADKLFRGKRAQRTLGWAERALQERGGMLIVIARFIPGGRTATTFSAGLLGYPWRRFLVFTAIGGTGWGLYAGLLGYLGGRTFEQDTWKALLLAFGIAGAVAVTVEVVRHFRRRGDEANA